MILAAGKATVRPDALSAEQVIVFGRDRHLFCVPVAAVAQVVQRTNVSQANGALGVAGFIQHGDGFVTTIDPAVVIDGGMPDLQGHVLLVETGSGLIGLLADRIQGLRTVEKIAPAPWLGGTSLITQSALVQELGHAYVIRPDDLRAYPSGGVRRSEDVATDEDTDELFLCFSIGEERFAAAFSGVDRILHDRTAWRLPGGSFPVRAVVEANGTVMPVLDLADGPICERGTFVVLLADCGAIALAVDTIDRPQRLRRNVGDAGWFDGPGVSGLAEGGATAFRILTGPALVGPAQAALTAAMPALIGGA